jgi:hypothetical protein
MVRKISLVLMVVSVASTAQSLPPEIRPGEYVRHRDSGTLIVRPGEKSKLTFEIESVGGNCHSCSVSGSIRGAVGHADSWTADGSGSKCEISFSSDRSAVVVRPISQEECRVYCGARAGFDGTYRIPPASCKTAGRQARRDRFLALYRSHRYLEAGQALQRLLAQCKEFMGWIEIDQVRSDLALSQYRYGEFSQCLATLGTTLAADVKDVEELRGEKGGVYLAPCDFDNYGPVAKSILFNRALCTKAMAKGR